MDELLETMPTISELQLGKFVGGGGQDYCSYCNPNNAHGYYWDPGNNYLLPCFGSGCYSRDSSYSSPYLFGVYRDSGYNYNQENNGTFNANTELYFNGKHLMLRCVRDGYIQADSSYTAVSGRPLSNGRFDYSTERQAIPFVGPIPEGGYYINPQEIQYLADRSYWEELKNSIGRGLFRGEEASWGIGRVWISPTGVVVGGRDGFSIHGGAEAGSAGCVDLVNNDKAFFKALEECCKYETKIKLTVKYGTE